MRDPKAKFSKEKRWWVNRGRSANEATWYAADVVCRMQGEIDLSFKPPPPIEWPEPMSTGMHPPLFRKDPGGSKKVGMPKNKPSLPSNRAFVVQLRGDADVEHGDFRGRVEHLVSMQATHFESVEELIAFIVRVVSTRQADDP